MILSSTSNRGRIYYQVYIFYPWAYISHPGISISSYPWTYPPNLVVSIFTNLWVTFSYWEIFNSFYPKRSFPYPCQLFPIPFKIYYGVFFHFFYSFINLFKSFSSPLRIWSFFESKKHFFDIRSKKKFLWIEESFVDSKKCSLM